MLNVLLYQVHVARDVKIMRERDEDSQHNFNMFLFNELPQKLWQFRLGFLSNMSQT
jgi:hypothetical protein